MTPTSSFCLIAGRVAGLTAGPCPAALHAVSHAAPGVQCAALDAAPGDQHAALDAAPSLPSGPQLLLTSLARQLALPNPRLLILQGKRPLPPLLLGGKSPFDAKALPI